MKQQMVMLSDNTNFFLIKHIDDKILSNPNLSKSQILEELRNLRDELDRYD